MLTVFEFNQNLVKERTRGHYSGIYWELEQIGSLDVENELSRWHDSERDRTTNQTQPIVVGRESIVWYHSFICDIAIRADTPRASTKCVDWVGAVGRCALQPYGQHLPNSV